MILKLEDQVCTIQQGKQLQELGVKVESVFVWDGNGNLYFIDVNGDYVRCIDFKTLAGFMMPNGIFPAYTAAEGLAMLPPGFSVYCNNSRQYLCDDVISVLEAFNKYDPEPTAAKAVFTTVINLLETGRITAAEINRKGGCHIQPDNQQSLF